MNSLRVSFVIIAVISINGREKICKFWKVAGGWYNIKACCTNFIPNLTEDLTGTVWSTIPVRIGVGTVIAVLGVGRVIALFNYIFMRKFVKLEIK